MAEPKVFVFVVLLLAIFAYGRSAVIDGLAKTENDINQDKKEPFSLEDVLTNPYIGDSFNGTWISESEVFYLINDQLVIYDVSARSKHVLARHPIFETGLRFTLSPDRNYVLIRNQSETVYRHSSLSICSVFSIRRRTLSILAYGRLLSTAKWAPRGSALVYVLDNDIYYHQVNFDSAETRRLTFDGKPQIIYNGVSDWVYEEEVLASSTAFWFSPNGEQLAFATFNDTLVHEAVILRYGEPGSLRDQYPVEEKFRYPKSGTTNPTVTLNVINLFDNGSSLIPLKAPIDIVGADHILFAVGWFDNNTVTATWTNRVQNQSQIVSYSLNGQYQPLFNNEVHDGWLLNPNVPPIRHGSHVLVLEPQPIDNSSLGLFSHVTRYRLLNGKVDRMMDLTPGEIWVHEIHGVNDVRRVVYYSGSPANEPSQKHLYEVSLDSKETKPVSNCLSCNLKSPEGNSCKYVSSASFSSDFSHYALTCAGPDPPVVKLYDLNAEEILLWAGSKELREELTRKTLPKQRDLVVEANGFDARVRLLLPDDFDPSKKYPLLVNVYAGPDSQRIYDGFAVGVETYLTTGRHVVHAWIDGRGSSSRGTANMYAVYRNLGSAEVEDQITVTRKLLEMFNWIDRNRTAVWGWSYGGYTTAMVLAKDLDYDVFKCGVSVAPVTNWIYYDSIYTERYMGLPTKSDNLKNYRQSSVLSRAMMLGHKKFMLVHGTGDDNVHYQQSMALSRALEEADVMFTQVTYPDEAHRLYHVTRHLYHSLDKFWSECLGYKM